MPNLFSTKWRWKNLVIFNLLAVLVLASWLWQPTRQLWDSLDTSVFHFLNAPLASNSTWAKAWAVSNMRPFDIGVGLIMLGLLIKRDWLFSGTQVRPALLGLVALLVMLLMVRFGFDAILKAMHWKRASPSLMVNDAVRLTKLFPDWEAHLYLKDSSEQCFPGDHASVLLIWAMLASSFARGWKLMLVWAITIMFMLPRLVAGAHWLSDDLVGGVFLSFVGFGWGYYSPYAARASAFLEHFCAPIFKLLRKIPLLNKLSLISGA